MPDNARMTSRTLTRVVPPGATIHFMSLPLALLAIVGPTLLAGSDPPSITFYNQVLAVLGWGLWMAALAWWTDGTGEASPRSSSGRPVLALSVVLCLCGAAAVTSMWATRLPAGLSLMAAGLMLSAWVVLNTAWRTAHRVNAADLMDLVCTGLAWAGVLGIGLAVIQVFVPEWVDGIYVAEPTMAGRAVGNVRQPNHFSTLAIWAVCGAAWLGRRGRWRADVATLVMVLAIGAVLWSASRTGMAGMVLLTLWGLRDKHLPRPIRAALLAAPLIYGAWWWGMDWWAHAGPGHAFAAQARLHDGSDISSSRFKIWSNTLDLIQAHPWTGVGWGEFNLAWTFTEFPDRPVAFFDHSHNLVLQWAVELGIPMAVLLTLLTFYAFWVLWWPWRRLPDGPKASSTEQEARQGVIAVSATIVGMAGMHSLVEYPLWYSYFLLPVAFVWGLGLAAAADIRPPRGAPDQARVTPLDRTPAIGQSWAHAVLGVAIALGALWCVVDYQWAANIYAPRDGAPSLQERIVNGQQRLWFGYQADYAYVTEPDEDEPSLPPKAFARTLHNLVDARLMVAYARSLAEHGQVDKARYVVQRLREFGSPLGQRLMAPCSAGRTLKAAPRPFQCDPPSQRYTWRQLVP